jgi:hypothetical protein
MYANGGVIHDTVDVTISKRIVPRSDHDSGEKKVVSVISFQIYSTLVVRLPV